MLEQGKKILHMPVDELKEYAIEVSGNRAHVTQWANGLEIITETGIEEDSMTIVVQNNLKKEKRIQGEKLGFELKPVAPSNLCLYLTDKARGGIDDVLNYR
ncbi:hypothetical protein [Paracerasibacillus soli]|uniref:Uncharacterized protein n=1 Tax=Paracerasibacillus soli TaxID=480284 RepID=A0ABU5CVF3_9BACI|nr:hypothetical protein [Virgibacillus soli]MDY0410296.1 hypothetical protein [Virgibacillus soli]